MRKLIAITAALCLAVPFVFAGASQEGSGSSSGTPQTVTLKVASWTVVEKGTQEYLMNLQSEFEKANPGIKIEWVGLPYGSYKQQLLVMAQAGELPDVLQAERSMFSAFTGPGYLADLGAVLPKDYVADIAPALKDDLTIDGTLYATPWLYSGFVLYYNKDLFSKAGLDPTKPPKSYEEALAYAEKLSKLKDADGNTVYGLGISTASVPVSGSSLLSMFASFGGGIWDASGQVNFNRPGNIAALAYLKDLNDRAYNPAGSKLKDLRNLFAIGRLGMYFDQLWGLNGVLAINPAAKNFAAAYLPLGSGKNPPRSTLEAHLLLISKTSKHPQEAAKFIEFVTSGPQLAKYFPISPFVPGRTSIAANPDFANQPLIAGLKGLDSTIFSVPKNPKIEAALLELASAAQLVIGGQGSPSEVAASTNAKLKDILQ